VKAENSGTEIGNLFHDHLKHQFVGSRGTSWNVATIPELIISQSFRTNPQFLEAK
jgi:hypothetical protein